MNFGVSHCTVIQVEKLLLSMLLLSYISQRSPSSNLDSEQNTLLTRLARHQPLSLYAGYCLDNLPLTVEPLVISAYSDTRLKALVSAEVRSYDVK
jgi:hypothetical protein